MILKGVSINISAYHITRPGAVCGQTNFESFALHIVPTEPDFVEGVRAGEEVLGENNISIHCETLSCILNVPFEIRLKIRKFDYVYLEKDCSSCFMKSSRKSKRSCFRDCFREVIEKLPVRWGVGECH